MSTRGIFCIVKDGEYKVSIYNYSDSYPSFFGINILKKLKENGYKNLEDNLNKMEQLTQKMIDEKCIELAGSLDKYLSLEKYEQYSIKDKALEYFNELFALDILDNKTGYYRDSLTFAADSLFCEWGYVIDLDKKTFEVFEGFIEEPLDENERFYFLSDKIDKNRKNLYYPIKFLISFDLDNLPDENNFLELIKIKLRA